MIIKIVRPYGGAEGHRIRAGTLFWCGEPRLRPDIVPPTNCVTAERGGQIVNGGLGIPVNEEGLPLPLDRARPVAPARRTQDIPAKPDRRRIPNEKNPPAPIAVVKDPTKKSLGLRQLNPAGTGPLGRQVPKPSQSGGQTGKGKSPSASPAAPPSGESTGTPSRPPRGQRSGSLPSTTPGKSPPAATSSTPQTSSGGKSTDLPPTEGSTDPALE